MGSLRHNNPYFVRRLTLKTNVGEREMTIKQSIIISFAALLLSVFSIYQQWLKTRYSKIAFLINQTKRAEAFLAPTRAFSQDYAGLQSCSVVKIQLADTLNKYPEGIWKIL